MLVKVITVIINTKQYNQMTIKCREMISRACLTTTHHLPKNSFKDSVNHIIETQYKKSLLKMPSNDGIYEESRTTQRVCHC